MTIDKTYQPSKVEGRIYRAWEEAGAFRAGRPERVQSAPYSIVIPPPNVTGSLHMGHALNNTLQDILCRFERMRGKDVLWQPGTDHAGIATQMVVERQLMERQQPSRREMGRETFLKRVWEWKAESGGAIVNQLKRLGASCDWSRERFTMDEGLSRAVLKVFVELYRTGLIYKDKRLVNWDPKLLTAISDLEVLQVEVRGHLWHIKYPIEGSEEVIIVAVPMNRLDYTFVSRQPINKPADLTGKKVGIGAVGGSDEVATRIALEKLGVNPSSVIMLTVGGSGERWRRFAPVPSMPPRLEATFIGGGAGLYKAINLTDLGVEFPFTGIFTTKRYGAANRDTVLSFIRAYMRGVRFFQENKEEAIAITARNLRTTNKELLERQWSYVKDHVFEKIPNASDKGFKLIFDMLSPRNPKVAALRTEDVFDASYVKELMDIGFFK